MNLRIAAGGVLFKISASGSVSVALIKRFDVWDIPKGEREDGENIAACAVREVSEELGVPTPSLVRYLLETKHTFERNGVEYHKVTHWFSMIETSGNMLTPQEEEGITEISWMELSLAKEKVGYQNLIDVLCSLEASLSD